MTASVATEPVHTDEGRAITEIPEFARLPAPDLSPAALAAVTTAVAATAAEYDRTGEVPVAGLEIAHRAGLLTATVGREFGGPGLDPLDTARILIALGEGDTSVALLAANNLNTHQGQAAAHNWPAELYRDYLARSLREPTLANTIRAEPELGAPARGGLPTTSARRTTDGWVLNGHKSYATGVRALAYHVVWVVAEEEQADEPRVGHLIVESDTPGIDWVDTWDHLGLRASNTHDVIYRDVLVPEQNFVEIPRGPDGVYRDPAAATALTSFGHAAIYIGVARAARTAFVDFARTRVPTALGRPIATTERIQTIAGEIDAQIAQAETLLFGALLRAQAGDTAHLRQLSLIKVQIARSVIAAVSTAAGALGNAGLTRHLPFERLLRDVHCVRVHPPQEDAALLVAGRGLLLPD
ncbi:acyl-CoA dehydrogenase family protein [Gordonia sp. ABSL1-1]|uniref:acyl-CoA dehydrogenase family protein n=1 Tax=Gordonia sp. ABSL1-1 TaxID=3053923 RepID=UPI002572404F|nr:acyl-CoA dehydrogenase family protein [Gordonia sp. ABSL1-1]MDL9937293.1 acyl-CoA dehydrogenase family protein [Gordonia sp. ABSL1-1]